MTDVWIMLLTIPVARMLAYIDSWNILRTEFNVTHAFDEPQSREIKKTKQ